jgi:hypothetical protein
MEGIKVWSPLSHKMWHFVLILAELKTALDKCFWLLPLYLFTIYTLRSISREEESDKTETETKNTYGNTSCRGGG